MGHVSNHMKEYCKLEKICRRRLLQNFIGGVDTTTIGNLKCNCCDICTQECTCSVECPSKHVFDKQNQTVQVMMTMMNMKMNNLYTLSQKVTEID